MARTAEVIREGITSARWRDFLPGERDLAVRLGISRPTLRSALELLRREGILSVRQGARRRITNPYPRSRTALRRIGMISPVPLSQAHPVVILWTNELRGHLTGAGYELQVLVDRNIYRRNPETALTTLVNREPADAWVTYLSTEPMQRWFAKRRLPVVVAGSCWPGVTLPSVDVDYRAICRHATGRLLGNGHRRIVHLQPGDSHAGDLESVLGIREALAAHGGATDELEVLTHDGTVDGITRKIDSILNRGPAAFVVARSAHALTTITYLLRNGYCLPEDVALISRDDDGFLDHVTPSVSRYQNSPLKFGREIFNLVHLLANRAVARSPSIRLLPEFIPGETG